MNSNQAIMERKKYKWAEISDHYGVESEDLPRFVLKLLQKYETVENLRNHLEWQEGIEISRETIDRFIKAQRMESYTCWRFIPTVIDAPIPADEGEAGACRKSSDD